MTPRQIEQARALRRCVFVPGTPAKRFAREMSARAENAPGEALTDKQAAYLDDLAHRFRRQVGRCLAVPPCVRCAEAA